MIKKIILIFAIPLIYIIIMFFGMAFAGAGHGSSFFGEVALAPYSAISESGWILIPGILQWFLIGSLIAIHGAARCRFIAAGLVLAHYAGVIALSLHREDWNYVEKVVSQFRILVVLLISAYIITQVFLWIFIIYSPTHNRLAPEKEGKGF